MNYRQARWREPLIFEYSRRGKRGLRVPEVEQEIKDLVGPVNKIVPVNMLRRSPPNLPEVSEVEVVRHYIRLSQMNFGVDVGPQPLGSCTMKYTPKVLERIVEVKELAKLHPLQDESTLQGIMEILYKLGKWLCEIVGLHKCTFQPAAGAHGELTGALIIKAYHRFRGEERDEMLIPDSAHGTNPASAAMAGFKVIKVPTREDGCVDLEALENALGERTAGLMLTNPNTLGLFEKEVLEISRMVHKAGGLMYYDGANLNGILGITRPGDMGFDIVHINIHKTFAAPHGGGGPGASALCVSKELEDFLPVPIVEYDEGRDRYYLKWNLPHTIGMVRSFYGNIVPLVKAFAYILLLGPEGLRRTAEIAVLNTNYFISKIRKIRGFTLPYDPQRPRKHEVVISARDLKRDTGVTAEDVAKALLDYGFYAPTIYFPQIVEEALMIEFTETESKESIDAFIEALKDISEKAYNNPKEVKERPKDVAVERLDMAYGNLPRVLAPTYWKYLERRKEGLLP